MIGKLISSTIKVVTLPIDTANAAADMMVGGDGSKLSRTRDEINPLAMAEKLRDRVADSAEAIDD